MMIDLNGEAALECVLGGGLPTPSSVFVSSKLVDLPQCGLVYYPSLRRRTDSAEVNSPSPRFQTPVETTPHVEHPPTVP